MSPQKSALTEMIEQKAQHDVFLKTQKASLEVTGHHMNQSYKKISTISKGSQESLKQHIIAFPTNFIKSSPNEEDSLPLSQEGSEREKQPEEEFVQLLPEPKKEKRVFTFIGELKSNISLEHWSQKDVSPPVENAEDMSLGQMIQFIDQESNI